MNVPAKRGTLVAVRRTRSYHTAAFKKVVYTDCFLARVASVTREGVVRRISPVTVAGQACPPTPGDEFFIIGEEHQGAAERLAATLVYGEDTWPNLSDLRAAIRAHVANTDL